MQLYIILITSALPSGNYSPIKEICENNVYIIIFSPINYIIECVY